MKPFVFVFYSYIIDQFDLVLIISMQSSVCLCVFTPLSGGGILLVEAMLFENRRGPIMAQLFSLNMLVQTEGREHSPSEYTAMLTKAGFQNIQVCRTGKSYDAILAIKWAKTGTIREELLSGKVKTIDVDHLISYKFWNWKKEACELRGKCLFCLSVHKHSTFSSYVCITWQL